VSERDAATVRVARDARYLGFSLSELTDRVETHAAFGTAQVISFSKGHKSISDTCYVRMPDGWSANLTLPVGIAVSSRITSYPYLTGPYFGVALQCLPGTELVLTLTSGMTSAIKNDRRLRLVKLPQEQHAFHLLMAWHPTLNTDPRHVWLRGAVRSTAAALTV
jgi:hypothetical protein